MVEFGGGSDAFSAPVRSPPAGSPNFAFRLDETEIGPFFRAGRAGRISPFPLISGRAGWAGWAGAAGRAGRAGFLLSRLLAGERTRMGDAFLKPQNDCGFLFSRLLAPRFATRIFARKPLSTLAPRPTVPDWEALAPSVCGS